MNFDKYYVNQAGSGLAAFSGVRYQKGAGFFGRLLSGAVIPFLKFLGSNALAIGSNVVGDLIDTNDFSKENIKEAAKKSFKNQVKQVKKGEKKYIKENRERKLLLRNASVIEK